MAERYTVASDQYYQITGQLFEIARQIRLKGGSSIDPKRVIHALQKIIDGQFEDDSNEGPAEKTRTTETFTTCVPGGCNIVIDALDGTETLATAQEVFRAGIDGDFVRWGTNKPGIATREQAVDVHKLVKHGTFAQMFGSLGVDLNMLCMSQAQIKKFCREHAALLSKTDATLFLFKSDEQFFVAHVLVDSGGLYVRVGRFACDGGWGPAGSHRMVVPRLAA